VTVAGDQGSGFFQENIAAWGNYVVTSSRLEELEGVTVYRGSDGLMYTLLVKLTNEADEDDVSLYWWYSNEP